MKDKLLFLFLLLFPLVATAQSVETIKSSSDYLWGEGSGESIREADQMALQNLVSKISLSVENSFVNVEKEVASNGGVDASTAMDHPGRARCCLPARCWRSEREFGQQCR